MKNAIWEIKETSMSMGIGLAGMLIGKPQLVIEAIDRYLAMASWKLKNQSLDSEIKRKLLGIVSQLKANRKKILSTMEFSH